jgi:heme oxygenase
MNPTSSLFLQSLKTGTSHQHRLLESNSLLSSLVSPGVNLGHYVRYLLLMQAVMIRYEAMPTSWRRILPGWRAPSMSAAIVQDLAVLKQRSYSAGSPPPFEIDLDDTSHGSLIGFIYVMEGSKLGGRVIAKHLVKHLGPTVSEALGFLAGYGTDTGREWKDFLTQFADAVVENKLEQETIEGATSAFTLIYDYFETNWRFCEV